MKVRKVIFAVCCLAVGGILGSGAFTRFRVAKATDVARDYVEKRYPFDIKCVGGEYSSLDPAQYYIHFETTDDEPLYFTVLVQHDLKISEERYSSSGEVRFVADNYLHQKFTKEAETYIKNVLGKDRALVDILVYCNNPLYAYSLPADVNEASTIDELLQKMDFSVMLCYDSVENSHLENIDKTLQEHGVNARDVLRQGDGSSVWPKSE